MKIGKIPGEFAFKALYKFNNTFGWFLTETYFFNQQEVMNYKNIKEKANVIWPVEVQDGQIVYIPDQSEFK